MAMVVKNGKIYILVADSDAVKENKVSISNNSNSETTNYCPPESHEENKLFYDTLGEMNKPVYTSPKKVKNFQNIITSRVKNKYADLFNGKMRDFDELCEEFNKNEVLIANKLFLTGSRPYLQFDGTNEWKKFKKIIYGEISSIVIESHEDKFICYPEFHPMFIKKNEYEELICDEESTNDYILNEYSRWLISYDNPDYDGKKEYKNYSRHLVKLIKFMYDQKLIDSKDLNSLDIEWYEEVLKVYESSSAAQNFDKNLSQYTGSASLKKYIVYIQFLVDKKNSKTVEKRSNGENVVFFGIPGCGKSYYLNNKILTEKKYPMKNDNTKDRVFRTTFYQDYTYSDFVGQILPHIEKDDKGEKNVTYEFYPGPFALALKSALENPNNEVALVIEELNRGNAPAIFGDIFQLLDRNEYGISEYSIVNPNLCDYLNEEIEGINIENIKIPGNLNIYATMNTSDQNVFTLDTAFKRRWKFVKLKNDFNDHKYKDYFVPGLDGIKWQDFVQIINDAIIGEKGERDYSSNVSDKQIGAYFVEKDGLVEKLDLACDDEVKIKEFAYKVFSYLWEDVAKFDKDQLFASGIKTLDELIDKYALSKAKIFISSIEEQFNKKAIAKSNKATIESGNVSTVIVEDNKDEN